MRKLRRPQVARRLKGWLTWIYGSITLKSGHCWHWLRCPTSCWIFSSR
jgi:hypothetical protein